MDGRDAIDLVRTLAERQHGVVARRQLLAAGVSRDRIDRWLSGGRLVRAYRGVYGLGHGALSPDGRRLAAVLACGPGAVLSHGSAAALWGLRTAGGARLDVTVHIDGPRSDVDGLRIHRSSLAGRFATEVRAIPVTSVAWTLLDYAAVARRHHVRRALEEADRLDLLDTAAIERALRASPRRPGSPLLLALLEAIFLEICLRAGLSRPRVNVWDGEAERDFAWPEHRLIVELDGWTFHRGRVAFEEDRARDRRALAEGWRVARFTASEVQRKPGSVAREMRRLLADRWHPDHG